MVVHEEGEVMPMEQDPTMDVFMDLTMLHCPFCLRPLKPPVYECKGGHLAYADCRGERLENQRQCQKCERGGVFDVRNTAMDAVLSSVRVECPHEGCGLYVTYYKLDDHQSMCPLAPCMCPVPGCGYEGPLPALPNHLSTVHPMPVHRIEYGKVLQLQVPVLEPRLLLFAEEDDRAFFVVGDALGMGAPIAVSVICISRGVGERATGGAQRQYRRRQGGIEVTSSKEPGTVTVEELTFLIVPPKLLVGAGSSRMVSLHIRIDKLTS